MPSSSSEVEVGCTIGWFGKLPLFGQKLDQHQQDVFFPPNKKNKLLKDRWMFFSPDIILATFFFVFLELPQVVRTYVVISAHAWKALVGVQVKTKMYAFFGRIDLRLFEV